MIHRAHATPWTPSIAEYKFAPIPRSQRLICLCRSDSLVFPRGAAFPVPYMHAGLRVQKTGPRAGKVRRERKRERNREKNGRALSLSLSLSFFLSLLTSVDIHKQSWTFFRPLRDSWLCVLLLDFGHSEILSSSSPQQWNTMEKDIISLFSTADVYSLSLSLVLIKMSNISLSNDVRTIDVPHWPPVAFVLVIF